MQDNAGKILIYTLAFAILIGALVLIFDKEYRIPKIIASNSTYYSGVIDEDIKKHAGKFVRDQGSKKTYKKYKSYKSYKKKRSSGTTKKITSININTANKNQLLKVPGITSSIAAKIIFYRKIHKGFKNKNELLKIPGITQDKYNYIKGNIKIK